MIRRSYVLAITGRVDYFSFGISCAQFKSTSRKIMATKKTATKTTASAPTPAEKTATPVAKKAAKKAAAKKVAPVAAKKDATPAITKKVVVPAAARKVAVKKVTAVKPSLDVIARAAYLNYRRRVEQGLPGNSQGDWLEAERQFAK